MRSSKSRTRGKPNRNRSSGSNVNRVFDSSGPEGKVRGTPQQIIDKYQQLTRDAQLSNDRVAAENFQQHAEHYTRLLGEAQREADTKRAEQEAQQRERQAQREAERPERHDADRPERHDAERHDTERPGRRDNRQPDPADAPQPDVAMDQATGDSGLVETPEARSTPKPRRPRKPRAPKENAPSSEAQPSEASDKAPEQATKKAPGAPDAPEAAE